MTTKGMNFVHTFNVCCSDELRCEKSKTRMWFSSTCQGLAPSLKYIGQRSNSRSFSSIIKLTTAPCVQLPLSTSCKKVIYLVWYRKLERFLPRNQHTQRKLLNFENPCNGEVSKSAKMQLSKSIFYVKNLWNVSQSFFYWKILI